MLLTGNFSKLGGDNKTNSTTELTNWKVPSSQDPENNLTKPLDFIQEVEIPRSKSDPETEEDKKPLREKNFIITLEPQRIRAFSITFYPPENDPLKK